MVRLLSPPFGPLAMLICFGLIIIILALVKINQLFIWINSLMEDLNLSRNIKRHNKKVKEIEKAYNNGVPPVLYLRAFATDGTKRSEKEIVINENPINLYKFKKLQIDAPAKVVSVNYNLERSLSDIANSIGPFIGIGNQFEKDINLGAMRLYFSDEVWQQSASLLMEQAALIIVKISGIFSNGFVWEISEIKARFLDKTIFCIDIYEEKIYNKFVLGMKELELNFPLRFNTFKNTGNYISFDADGQFDACPHLDLHSTVLQCRKNANKLSLKSSRDTD